MATGRYPIANATGAIKYATAALEFLNAHLTTGASREQSLTVVEPCYDFSFL